MSYALELTDAAVADVAALSPELQGAVEANLDRLAAAPASLSRRTAFPFPPSGQMFQFKHTTTDGRNHQFTVFFLYLADEETLRVARVMHQPIHPPAE